MRHTPFARRQFTADKSLTADLARELVSYDPLTGELRWRASPRYGIPAGSLISTKGVRGYIQACVAGFKTTGHRLAWLLHYGKWPTYGIDHINRIKDDNRIENLRDVPQAVNLLNREVPARKAVTRTRLPSGDRISVFARGSRFRSCVVKPDGRKVYAGTFDTREQAERAAADLRNA